MAAPISNILYGTGEPAVDGEEMSPPSSGRMLNTQYSHPHTNNSCRLLAYSDAIFAIIATVMVLPISNGEISEDQALSVTLIAMYGQFSVYLLSFWLITNTWINHTWLFQMVEKTDDITAILNLVMMMTVTFLPFAFVLFGFYSYYPEAIMIFCACIIGLDLLQMAIVFYICRNTHLLSEEFQDNVDLLKIRRNGIYFNIAIGFSLCFTVFILALIGYFSGNQAWTFAALLFLLPLLFGDPLKAGLARLYRKIKHVPLPLRKNQCIDKERVEAYTDGIYAIIGTFLILDICENHIPLPEDVIAQGLGKLLTANDSIFLAYIGSFVMIGALWFVQQSLFKYLHEATAKVLIFNNWSLAIAGFLPFAFKLTGQYMTIDQKFDETTAIQFTSFLLCMAGLFQFCSWTAALYKQDVFVNPKAHWGTEAHLYLTIQLSVIPLYSFFLFTLGYNSYILTSKAFNSLEIGIVLIFLVLKLIFIVRKRHFEGLLNGHHPKWS